MSAAMLQANPVYGISKHPGVSPGIHPNVNLASDQSRKLSSRNPLQIVLGHPSKAANRSNGGVCFGTRAVRQTDQYYIEAKLSTAVKHSFTVWAIVSWSTRSSCGYIGSERISVAILSVTGNSPWLYLRAR